MSAIRWRAEVARSNDQALYWFSFFPYRCDEFCHASARLDASSPIVMTFSNSFIDMSERLASGCGIGWIEDRKRCREDPSSIVQRQIVTSPFERPPLKQPVQRVICNGSPRPSAPKSAM